MSEVIADTTQRAAKAHHCDHCGKSIAIGESYRRIRGVWDGDPGVFRAHIDCEDVARKMHRNHGLCSDEGIILRSDVEAEDAVWIKIGFPMVAERLGL
jgi:hypothetical protein